MLGLGGTLHEEAHAVAKNWNCRQHYQNREKEGADWVGNRPSWLDVNNDCSYYDSSTLNHVAHHVHDSSAHIQIFGF